MLCKHLREKLSINAIAREGGREGEREAETERVYFTYITYILVRVVQSLHIEQRKNTN